MARLRIGGKRTMTFIVSAYIAPPALVAIMPLFLLVRSIGLMDSLIGLIIVEALVVCPVAVWLLDTFFRAIPPEVDEAAQIDGCGPVATLFAHPAAGLSPPGWSRWRSSRSSSCTTTS